MRIHADGDVCIGSGVCVMYAPDVFDQDDRIGTVIVRTPAPPPEAHDDVRAAVRECPSRALRLEALPASGERG